MKQNQSLYYCRVRWPDAVVPEGEPQWLLYELDKHEDTVLRTVDIHADGKIFRNSVDLEQRNGDVCPSLIDTSIVEAFDGVEMETITSSEFEKLWLVGEDRPFWFVH
jgi:hypothetical protein